MCLGVDAQADIPLCQGKGRCALVSMRRQICLGVKAKADLPGCRCKGQSAWGWEQSDMKSAKNVWVVFRMLSYINENHCYPKSLYRRFMHLCKFCIPLQFCCSLLLKCCKKPAYAQTRCPVLCPDIHMDINVSFLPGPLLLSRMANSAGLF